MRTMLSSLRGTRASSSSKKITQGDEARAREKTCLTALSLSPTYCVSMSLSASSDKMSLDLPCSAAQGP